MRLIVILLLSTLFSCDTQIEEGVMKSDLSKDVEFVTDFGPIIMRLSDYTPIHRNNFIKLVNEKYYDSIAFHRVMDNFMIQAGNPTTKPSKTYSAGGNPELNYTIEAEIKPNLFHKRGALAAARSGGISNPDRLSSGLQFYIVQNGKQNDNSLNEALETIDLWTAKNNVMNLPKVRTAIDKYLEVTKNLRLKDEKDLTEADTLLFLSSKEKVDLYNIDSLAEIEVDKMKKYSFPKSHLEIYKTLGGEPRLDQNYTVFGEVVKGMNVVDSIAAVKTNDRDKPLIDVKIISARLIKREHYK